MITITKKMWLAMYPKLLRYATSLTGQNDSGKDLVMEVITKIFEAENLPADLNLEAYATRSIKNLFLNNLKKEF